MIKRFFKKYVSLIWLPWLFVAPILFFALVPFSDGNISKSFGMLAFFVSIFFGIALGPAFSEFLNKHLHFEGTDIKKRLSSAISVFGFLGLPPAVGAWSNKNLGTEIGLEPLALHFHGAFLGALLSFSISPKDSD